MVAQRMAGKIVALAGARKSAEMATLVEKMGGTAWLLPAQGTVFLDDAELRKSLEQWLAAPPEWVILTTGMGLDAIFSVAEEAGVAERLLAVLQDSNIAARGYKTVNALKKRGLTPSVRDDDGSTTGLIRSFGETQLQGQRAILQLHGESAPELLAWLTERGADVTQVLPYKHIPPQEEHLEKLLHSIVTRELDAVTFTSRPQIHFLAAYAREKGQFDEMLEAFRDKVVAVAIGKVTAQAMREEGVEPRVIPEEERMGSMMVELGRYFADRS